jgi:serine/threonine-protein kinase
VPRPRATDVDPLIGTTIADRWQITRLIAGGDAGDIYAAKDVASRSRAAIKLLHTHLAEHPDAIRRFEREYDTAKSLTHPNLISPIDRGRLPDGRPWFAMELAEGRTLEAILMEGPLPPHRALGIAAQIAEALAVAHAQGIVHRDVCPSNVMVGRGDHVKLVDFGLALQDTAERITLVGLRLGSPLWMSPEAARGDPVGPAADVYGLGCVLFASLCARAPFLGGSMKVLEAHASSPPPPLVIHVAGLPNWLDELVASLMAKDPESRPKAERVARILATAARDLESSDVHPATDSPTNPRDSYPVGVTQGSDAERAPEPEDLPKAVRPEAVMYALVGGAVAIVTLGLIAGVLWSAS